MSNLKIIGRPGDGGGKAPPTTALPAQDHAAQRAALMRAEVDRLASLATAKGLSYDPRAEFRKGKNLKEITSGLARAIDRQGWEDAYAKIAKEQRLFQKGSKT